MQHNDRALGCYQVFCLNFFLEKLLGIEKKNSNIDSLYESFVYNTYTYLIYYYVQPSLSFPLI